MSNIIYLDSNGAVRIKVYYIGLNIYEDFKFVNYESNVPIGEYPKEYFEKNYPVPNYNDFSIMKYDGFRLSKKGLNYFRNL